MRGDPVKDFFLGFIGLHILHHSQKEAIYGAAIQEELRRHGYSLSFGTLYPLFHRLERDGYLVSKTKLVSGKLRRLYSITEAGRTVLAEGKAKARELLGELEEEL